MRPPLSRGLLLGLCAALLVASSAAAEDPVFTPLGDLPGGVFQSSARDVSADGAVVVGASRSAAGLLAFRWDAVNGMVSLGDLPGAIDIDRVLLPGVTQVAD